LINFFVFPPDVQDLGYSIPAIAVRGNASISKYAASGQSIFYEFCILSKQKFHILTNKFSCIILKIRKEAGLLTHKYRFFLF